MARAFPNQWEELSAWNDLISWRNHMFSHISNVLGRLDQTRLDAARDGHAAVGTARWCGPSSAAHVARRHALPETCINIIAKLASVSSGHALIDLADAFAKTLE